MIKNLLICFLIILGISNKSFAAVNLIISNGSVPSSMYCGLSYSITIYVKNSGTTSTTTSFNVNVSINTSNTYNGNQTYRTDIPVNGGINAGVTKTLNTTITIPSSYATGRAYILAGADSPSKISESSETDNNNAFITQINTLPDLTPSSYSISTHSINAGSTITASFAVNNSGTTSTGNFNVGFYLSSSSTLNTSNATLLGTYPNLSITQSTCSAQFNKSLTIPSLTCNGPYYLHIWIDNGEVVTESVDNNNFQSMPLTVTGGPPTPSTPTNPSSNSPQCGNVTITRSGSPPSGETWYWQGTSSGTSTNLGSGTTFTASSSGTYNIRSRNSCGIWSSGCGSVNVVVNSIPSIPANPTSGIPQNGNVTLTRNGTPPSGVTWYWQLTSTGTSTSLGSGSTYIATSSGSYYIRSRNSAGCWSTDCGSVSVNIPCNYTFTPQSNTTVPKNGNTNYKFDIATNNNCTWNASVGSYTWITITSAISGTGPGNCTYKVIENPDPITRTGYITISGNQFKIVQDAADYASAEFVKNDGYINSPVKFTDNSSGSPDLNNWSWDFGDNNPLTYTTYQPTISHTFTTSGLKTIKLIVKNNNVTSNPYSQTINIALPPKPEADFISDNNILPNTPVKFSDNSKYGPSTWQWVFYGGTPSSSTDPNPTVTYSSLGTHSVKLTVTNISGTSSKTKDGWITVKPLVENQCIPPIGSSTSTTQVNVAEPIQAATGSYQYSHKDFNIPTVNGSINFKRFYNSINNELNSQLGYGWSHTYNYYLDIQRGLTSLRDTVWRLHYPDGHFSDFIPYYTENLDVYPRKSFALYSGTFDSLAMINSNKYILYTKDNYQYNFNSSGHLIQITDLNNNITLVNYSGNKISNITGQGGRSIVLSYTGSYITSISEPNNRKYIYAYDASGNLETSKDPIGGTTTYSYDVNHRLNKIKNRLNDIILSNTYDSQGRIIEQMDADNQKTKLEYDTPSTGKTTITYPDNTRIIATHDQFFRKTNIIDELDYSTSFSYDSRSNQTGYTNENGQSDSRQYDWMGNIKSKTIGSNITTQYIYNNLNTPTQITDPNGETTVITYDGSNNLTSLHLPDNTVQYFTYNTNGTKNKFTDGGNNSSSYTYTTNGDLLNSVAPCGTKKFDYDPSGRLTLVTDENNQSTKILYDDNDNIKTITDAISRTTEFAYDSENQLLSLKDKNGNLTKFTYDKKGRLKTTTNPKGGITTYSYDLRDNLISVLDHYNNTINYTYDKKGRKSSTINALGTTQYKYDGVGNLTKLIDGTNKTLDYTYTPTNKIESVKDGLNNHTNFTYDKNDNLVSIINALNKTSTYSYDEMNRLISVLDPDSKTTTFTYDENGNRKTISDPNKHIQYFTYDPSNRLKTYVDGAGNTTNYEYDFVGNIKIITKPTGTIVKSYDNAYRITNVTNSGGNNYIFTYDNNDNITTMKNNLGTVTMVYDSLNRLLRYTDPFDKTVSFTYDKLGNKTSIIYPENHTVKYKYDNVYNLKSVTDWLDKTFTYTYDAAGRNTQLVYPNGIHNDIIYDDAGRLISKKNITNTNEIINSSQFVLDEMGNRISEQREGPIPTSLVPSTNTYNYSNEDDMKSNSIWNYTNDANGNRTIATFGTKSVKFSYSVDNLLTNFQDTTGFTITYNYDPLGHRLNKKTIGSLQLKYVLDLSSGLSKVLQITNENGLIKSEYVYGVGLLERIDSLNNVLYYHNDAQYNIVALTNQTATITDSYTYDPFGSQLTHKGSTLQPFSFLGDYGVEQDFSSLYYVRARYYDSDNGRFLSKDNFPSILNSPQSLNRYVYGINNPILNTDPTGLFSPLMFITGVTQYLLGTAEGAAAYVTGQQTLLSPLMGSPVLTGVLGLVTVKTANDALKEFNVGNNNIWNSFKKGNTIANAKFSEDGDIKNILTMDKLLNKPEIKTLTDGYTVASGIVSGVQLVGNAPNIFSASKYLFSLFGYSSQAILQNMPQVKDLIDGVGILLKDNNSNCNNK